MNIENIDIRDLVLIGGGLFIVAIIMHGLWLAWRSRQDPLRMEISPDLIPDDDDEMARFRGELPNGGGRPVIPVQKDLNFDEAVPVLLDPVATPRAEAVAAAPPPPLSDAAGDTGNERTPIRAQASEAICPNSGPGVAGDTRRSRSGARDASETRRESRSASADTGGGELLMINVLAPNGQEFAGEALLAAMRGQGLKYGDMNIFHRRDPHTGKVQFSVANALEPGYFDLAEISNLVSPGLVFFIQLPGPEKPGEALEDMIRITKSIAEELGAVLKDENLSAVTGQTVEHYRERVADYSRRRLSKRA